MDAATGCRVLKALRVLAVLGVILVPCLALALGWSWPVFSWLGQGDYAAGLAEFFIGVGGALVAAYLLLGIILPPTGEVRSIREELRGLKERRAELFKAREGYVYGQAASGLPALDPSQVPAAHALSDDLEKTIARLEQRLADERWRFLRLTIPLYALFGGLASTALTRTPKEGVSPAAAWQSLLLGFALAGLAIGLVSLKDWLQGRCQQEETG